MDIIQEIWEDYKKPIIIVLAIILAFVIGAIIFSAVYNPIKITFTGDDAEMIATMSKEIKLGAKAADKSGKEYEIEWEVSDGTLSSTKTSEVIWELPKESGTYTITVKAGDKIRSKNITLITNQIGSWSLDSNDNIEYIDSDGDGLSDKYEKEVSNTEPSKIDTDEDVVNDGAELVSKLNPIEKESKTDGIQDDERKLEYTLSLDNIGIDITLKGTENISGTTVDLYNLKTLNEIQAVVSNVYSIKQKGNVDNAKISIKYDKNIIASKGLSEKDLAIYMLDFENNKYVKQESTVNAENSTVTTKVMNLGKFFIADSSKMKDKVSTELMFVIDNSGSMYSKEMVDGSEENDTQFKRVDLSNRIIDKLKGDYKFGAGKFTFEYEELASMTSDKEKVKEKINSIKTLTEKFSGTYIGNALEGGLKQFGSNNLDTRKYMILLTDGKDTREVDGYDDKKTLSATNEAKQKGVKVFTIGLGTDLDTEVLQNIASQTGGKYYYANSSEVLEDVFELIAADINYSLVDFDKDATDDYIIYANNNFLAKKNGMPMENFSTTTSQKGATYGMSLFAKLYYENKLPSKMSSISVRDRSTGENIKVDGYEMDIDRDTRNTLLSNFELEDLKIIKNIPKDFMANEINGGSLKISDKYKKELNTLGFTYYELKYDNSKSGFKKYETYMLNNDYVEDKEKEKSDSALSATDKNFVDAIYRLDILKNRDERISFEKEPDKAYKYVVDSVLSSQVALLVLNDDYTVCVQKVLVDVNDDNHIKFEVYDSNYGGKQQYIDVQRTKIFNSIEGNDKNNYQYKFTYNDKKVSVSVSIPNVDVNL